MEKFGTRLLFCMCMLLLSSTFLSKLFNLHFLTQHLKAISLLTRSKRPSTKPPSSTETWARSWICCRRRCATWTLALPTSVWPHTLRTWSWWPSLIPPSSSTCSWRPWTVAHVLKSWRAPPHASRLWLMTNDPLIRWSAKEIDSMHHVFVLQFMETSFE